MIWAILWAVVSVLIGTPSSDVEEGASVRPTTMIGSIYIVDP